MICQIFKIYLFVLAVEIAYVHTDRQTGRQTGRRIDRHTDKKTERQINRQTVRHTDIQDIHIYTHGLTRRPTINYTIPSSACSAP